MGRIQQLFVGVSLCLAVTGCEKKVRSHGAVSVSLTDDVETTSWAPSSAYRFVSADQTLGDARRALTEERWADAAGAAEAMLKNNPGSPEARNIDDKAKLEGPNQLRYAEFQKASTAGDMLLMARHFRQMSDASLYKEKARPVFEKTRDAWIDSQSTDTRALAHAGRCEEARRMARVTIETFAETRGSMDNIVASCRTRDGKVIAAAERDKPERPERAERTAPERSPDPPAQTASATPPPAPPPAATAPPAAVAPPVAEARPSPALVASIADKRPSTTPPTHPIDPSKQAAEAPTPAPAPGAVVSATPPPAAHAAGMAPKSVPAGELEALRLAGDKNPTLSAGAKQIAHRDGVKMIQMAVSLCLNERGVPSSVNMKLSSDYSDANEKLLHDVRGWRFKPYLSSGQPVPVCTAYVFRYMTN